MGENFNKKLLRGARVIRVKENIELAIKTLRGQLPLQEEMGNDVTAKIIKGKIEGMELALSMIMEEFEK